MTAAAGTGRRRWGPAVAAWALWGLAVASVLAALVAATVGAVLAGRRPRHPVGWLLLGLELAVTGSGVADGYARYGLLARPGALPAAHWVADTARPRSGWGSSASASSCCSPRAGRCRRPAGAGGRG